jgi:Protein of unknown function (DUF5131)
MIRARCVPDESVTEGASRILMDKPLARSTCLCAGEGHRCAHSQADSSGWWQSRGPACACPHADRTIMRSLDCADPRPRAAHGGRYRVQCHRRAVTVCDKLLAAILLEVASQLVTDPAARPVMSDLLLVQRRFLSCEPLPGRLHRLNLAGIGWVITGGESGPGPPAGLRWIAEIRGRCIAAGVPFFFNGAGKTPKAGGRELEGRTWSQMPTLTAADA